jgi:hypothetical protein
LGHELRAAHHSFFWLLIFKDALRSIQSELKQGISSEAQFDKAAKRIAKEMAFFPETALYKSQISNEMQCFTNYEPRADPLVGNLSSLVVNQVTSAHSRIQIVNAFSKMF